MIIGFDVRNAMNRSHGMSLDLDLDVSSSSLVSRAVSQL
jgi:hypothetical protein